MIGLDHAARSDETCLQRKSNRVSDRAIARAGVLAESEREFAERERAFIEAALMECQGKISTLDGGAARQGKPLFINGLPMAAQ